MTSLSTGADLRVGHAGLDLAAQDLGSAAQTLDATRAELNGALERLRPQWTGAAQDAYTPARAQWDRAVDEMVALLRDIGVTTGEVNRQFQDADRRSAGLF